MVILVAFTNSLLWKQLGSTMDGMDNSTMYGMGDMDGMDGMMMQMTYTWSSSVTILFNQWDTTNNTSFYCVSLLALFLIAVAGEAWSAFTATVRARSQRQEAKFQELSLQEGKSTKSGVRDILGSSQENLHLLLCAICYTIKLIIGYQLMLAVMTFNVGVSIAVFSGAFVGNFIFARFGQRAGDEIACHL